MKKYTKIIEQFFSKQKIFYKWDNNLTTLNLVGHIVLHEKHPFTPQHFTSEKHYSLTEKPKSERCKKFQDEELLEIILWN